MSNAVNPFPLVCFQGADTEFNINLDQNIEQSTVTAFVTSGMGLTLIQLKLDVLNAVTGLVKLSITAEQCANYGKFYLGIRIIKDSKIVHRSVSTFNIVRGLSNSQMTEQPLPVIIDDGNNVIEEYETLEPLFRSWTLKLIPKRPDLSRFYINGQKQIYGIDYTINSTLVTWMGYNLKFFWTIEIYYI